LGVIQVCIMDAARHRSATRFPCQSEADGTMTGHRK
jgi:hypothetical protein